MSAPANGDVTELVRASMATIKGCLDDLNASTGEQRTLGAVTFELAKSQALILSKVCSSWLKYIPPLIARVLVGRGAD